MADRDEMTMQLEERLRQGEAEALAALFEQCRGDLVRILRFRMAGALERRIDLDDLLQEVYLAAAARIERFAADGYAEAIVWLRQLALQTLVDQQRHHLGAQKRDAHRERSMSPGGAATSAAMVFQFSAGISSPSAKLKREDQVARLRAVIEDMEPIDREVLALRHFEGLGNKAIAEVLGISVKAASLRYVRALRRLQDELEAGGLELGDG